MVGTKAIHWVGEGLMRIGSYFMHTIRAKQASKAIVEGAFINEVLQKCFVNSSRIGSYRLEWDFITSILAQTKDEPMREIGAKATVYSALHARHLHKIIRTSASSSVDARALCDLVCFFKPSTIIELGTSAGLTTRALAQAAPSTPIISIEGNAQMHQIAKQHLHVFAHVSLHCAYFDAILPQLEWQTDKPSFVFIDGNHTYNASLRYFSFFRLKATKGSVVVHDIRWSTEMMRAWKEIVASLDAGLIIETYNMGIVVINPDVPKQHLRIRY